MLAVEVSLDIDPIGILMHTGLFLVVVFVLSRLILQPLLRVRDQRTSATTGKQSHTAQIVERALALEADYDARLKTARQEAATERESLRQAGALQAAEIVNAVRAEIQQVLATAREQFAKDIEAAKEILTLNANEFAKVIADRLLEKTSANHMRDAVTDLRSVVGKGD